MTGQDQHNELAPYFAILDAWREGVTLACSLAKLGFAMRGHAEAIDNLGAPAAGANLTGPDLDEDMDIRALKILSRYTETAAEIGPMPGLDPEDARRVEAI